jgi:hypothetical protein
MTATAAMPLPSHLAAALASAAARRRRSERDIVTAVGTTWKAVLLSNQRGPVVSRKAETREGAFAMARVLLDQAESQQWHRGERVQVEVAQAEG